MIRKYNLKIMMTEPNPNDPTAKKNEREKARLESHLAWYKEENIEDKLRIIGYIRDRSRHSIIVYCQLMTNGITIYDACIEFDYKPLSRKIQLIHAPIRGVFSNMPSFTYKYTYPLNRQHLIIPKLKHKCAEKSLALAPVRNNKHLYIGVDKSLYATAMFLMQRYDGKSIEDLITDKDISKLKTSYHDVENLIATQEEIAVIREMDTKHYHKTKKEDKAKKNKPHVKKFSSKEGSVYKTNYTSPIENEKHGEIVKQMKVEAINRSGKKDKIGRTSAKYKGKTKRIAPIKKGKRSPGGRKISKHR